jgi:hypothetical protein
MKIVHSRWFIVDSLIVMIVLLFICTRNCYAVTWSSNELIDKSKELDGRKLDYRGEYSWVNLNDGSNAIGVWCKSSLLGGVKFIGNYMSRGDTIEVNGVLNRACPVHNGELDIHADTVNIVLKGHPFLRPVDPNKINSAMMLFAITVFVVVIFRKRL